MLRIEAIRKPLIAALLCAVAAAPEAQAARSAVAPWILTAPPRETAARALRDYGPVATFLSRALDHPVQFRHPDSWLQYESWIRQGKATIWFDGPQFIAWRIVHLEASPGPVIPQPRVWELYTWKGSSVRRVRDAAGLSLCAPPEPNFGALWESHLFTNPVRQPYVIDTHAWKAIYKAVRTHACATGIGPKHVLDQLASGNKDVMILRTSRPLPNQGFSYSKSLSPAEQARATQALLSPAGEQALLRVRQRFADGLPLVQPAAPGKATARIARWLNSVWGELYPSAL